jgi:hypothetical protein
VAVNVNSNRLICHVDQWSSGRRSDSFCTAPITTAHSVCYCPVLPREVDIPKPQQSSVASPHLGVFVVLVIIKTLDSITISCICCLLMTEMTFLTMRTMRIRSLVTMIWYCLLQWLLTQFIGLQMWTMQNRPVDPVGWQFQGRDGITMWS